MIRCRILQDSKLGVESQGPVPSVELVDEVPVLLRGYGGGKDALVWRPHEPEPHLLHGFARRVVCWCGMSALLETKHLTRVSGLSHGSCFTHGRIICDSLLQSNSFVCEDAIVDQQEDTSMHVTTCTHKTQRSKLPLTTRSHQRRILRRGGGHLNGGNGIVTLVRRHIAPLLK